MTARQALPASSVTRALSIVGDSWTLLILLNAFRGARRYNEWSELLGIPRTVLSDRLGRLVKAKILARTRYQSNPPRFDYRLTQRGLGLWPFTLAIWDWEKRWLPDSSGFAFGLVHDVCNRRVRPRFFCAHCDKLVPASAISRTPGPGAGSMSLPSRRQRRTVVSGLGAPSVVFHDQTTRILGDRWSMLLIYAGLRGLTRFSEMHAELNVSTHLLSMRLRELVSLGIFERVRYSDRPLRHEYRLTAKGSDIYKLGVFAMYWGDRWLAQPGGPPTIVYHRDCQSRLIPQMRCSNCGQALDRAECHFEPVIFPERQPPRAGELEQGALAVA